MELTVGNRYLAKGKSTKFSDFLEFVVLEISPDGKYTKTLTVSEGDTGWFETEWLASVTVAELPPLPMQPPAW